jgi:hypothetical protein
MKIDLGDFPERWEGKLIEELFKSCEGIPTEKGVYCVLYKTPTHPFFLNPGTGGYFKGRDPNVPINELEKKWVDGADIIYIGQTTVSLRKRICTFMKFGQGKHVAHHGGRFFWQIQGVEDLIVCWKALDEGEDPRLVERALLREFKEKYRCLPFANPKGWNVDLVD